VHGSIRLFFGQRSIERRVRDGRDPLVAHDLVQSVDWSCATDHLKKNRGLGYDRAVLGLETHR
jgi:hypothetical protein